MAPTGSATPLRKPRTIYSLNLPDEKVRWPHVTSAAQGKILESLCSLLSPIGHHRSQHVIPSKGKRHRKRKRKDGRGTNEETISSPPTRDLIDPQNPPFIQNYVTIGFNSTHRQLESLVRPLDLAGQSSPISGHDPGQSNPLPLRAIFVISSSQSTVLHAHLPLLVRSASIRSPSSVPTRLIVLPSSAGSKLETALGVPRVSLVGLLDGAPGAEALFEFITQQIDEVSVPWFEKAATAIYQPVNIKAIETTAPGNLEASKGKSRDKSKEDQPKSR